MKIKIEEWRDVENTSGEYQVSNRGRVKSLKNGKETILNGWIQNTGYKTVSINNKKESVHRLVAKAFVPNPHNKRFVNHIDGNKQNNLYTNLEWVTPKENVQHAYRIGLMKEAIKKIAAMKVRAKIVGQFDLDGNLLNKFKGSVEAEKYLRNQGVQVNARNIRNVCQGNRNKAGGYKWQYLD